MVAIKEDTQPANCPLCGRIMMIVNHLMDFSIQTCIIHGVFVVDKPTNDTWVLEGFDRSMTPIRGKWYSVEDFKPLTVDRYRELVKWANLRRLEEKSVTKS